MEAIRHQLIIKEIPEKVYAALTTEDGLKSWWAKQTTAKPEVGFVNSFTFGKIRNQFKVTRLVLNEKVEWICVDSIDEWKGTTVSFDLEEKNGATILRFHHANWREVTETFAKCNYDWAQFMRSLKLLSETGTGIPA